MKTILDAGAPLYESIKIILNEKMNCYLKIFGKKAHPNFFILSQIDGHPHLLIQGQYSHVRLDDRQLLQYE